MPLFRETKTQVCGCLWFLLLRNKCSSHGLVDTIYKYISIDECDASLTQLLYAIILGAGSWHSYD